MYIQRDKKMDEGCKVLGEWGILRVEPLPKNFIEYPSMRDNIPCNSKYLCVKFHLTRLLSWQFWLSPLSFGSLVTEVMWLAFWFKSSPQLSWDSVLSCTHAGLSTVVLWVSSLLTVLSSGSVASLFTLPSSTLKFFWDLWICSFTSWMLYFLSLKKSFTTLMQQTF